MKSLALAVALLIAAAPPALADAEANKQAVLEFYDEALNQKDFEAASKYFGPRYIQHNPGAPDGIEGFKAFIALRKEKFPNAKSEIKRGVADVDIFRLENGKIVEHWDVVQPIPEKTANNNGMF